MVQHSRDGSLESPDAGFRRAWLPPRILRIDTIKLVDTAFGAFGAGSAALDFLLATRRAGLADCWARTCSTKVVAGLSRGLERFLGGSHLSDRVLLRRMNRV